jgi:hypothetical protein
MRASEINMLLKMGLSEAQIRKLKKSIKGQSFTVGTGTTTGSLQLSGVASHLLGFRAFDVNNAGVQIDFLLNQELIYSGVHETLLDTVLGAVAEEYIETYRKLNKQDVFNFVFNSTAGTTLQIQIFYLNEITV